jgi:hypothetical protein
MGARGVNNLSSKLLLTLFPPNTPFFKLPLTAKAIRKLQLDKRFKADIEMALSEVEQEVMSDIETKSTRTPLFQAFRQLLVGGNVTLFVAPDGPPRVYSLDRYVCRRSPSGKLLEWIGEDPTTFSSLDKETKDAIRTFHADKRTVQEIPENDANVTLYTYVWWTQDRYRVFQEVCGVRLPGSDGSWPETKIPYLPIRFNAASGESYGRGYVEEYYGDLQSLEVLQEAMLGSAAIVSRILYLIAPGSSIRPDELTKARNGDALVGRKEDVQALMADRSHDMRVAVEMITKLEQRLAFAFLLNTAVQRNGERVTAEEIRYMARELEDALGGTYSVLSQDLQLPFVRIKLDNVEGLGQLPKGVIEPAIVTGLDALGRSHNVTKVAQFVQFAQTLLGPQAHAYIKSSNLLKQAAADFGVVANDIVKTEEEVQAEQAQAMQMQLANRVAPNVVNKVGDAAIQQAEGQ